MTTGKRLARDRRPILMVVLTLVAALSLSACGVLDAEEPPASKGMAAAGFTDDTGLELAYHHYENRGMDPYFILVWRGSSADIDRALATAAFTTPFEPSKIYPSDFEVLDHSTLSNARRARDRWQQPDGYVVAREFTRAHTNDGREALELLVAPSDLAATSGSHPKTT